MNKKNVKSTIIFVSYNVIIVLFLLISIELTLGYLIKNPAKIPTPAKSAFSRYYRQIERNTIQVENDCAQYNSDFFYLLKPGKCQFQNIEFNTSVSVNRAGLRDTDESLESPSIIFLGDSFTMGWGVEQNEAFPQLIGAAKKIKTLNAGISSFGTARELLLLKSLTKDSIPLLIIQYHDSDANENNDFLKNNGILKVSSKMTYDSLCQAYNSQKKYYPGKLISYIGSFFLRENIVSKNKMERNYVTEAKNFIQVLQSFSEIKLNNLIILEIASHNKNSNRFIHEVKKQIDSDHFPPFIKNATFIELEDKFTADDYFILDDHLNAKGHAKLAQIILDNL